MSDGDDYPDIICDGPGPGRCAICNRGTEWEDEDDD